ncbi:MAG TPA: AraC family transcriptional regulator [Steroidobacter sp.]|uniref:AraC family transcriptional regulator n=1 Tax=Steroidobacter sp. TaxID=1978227 RepID=UPI002ED7FD63
MSKLPVLERLKESVRRYADQHSNADGLAITPVPGLRMMRVYKPSGPIRSMYRPLVCLVLQGAKQMTVGRTARTFTAGQAVIVAVDLPVIGRIVEATRSQPYLAVAIEVDMTIMQLIASQVAETRPTPEKLSPLAIEQLDDDIVLCAERLMRLVDEPDAVPVLRPAVLQELHYWLLKSRYGPSLRALSFPQGNTQRILVAIEIIRKDFRKPIAVEELAAAANMSPSAFHRHFRAVTSLSPLQFQKQLRLIEARRLMLNERVTARRAAFQVGYESASQFTREYHRTFGAPPRTHATGKKPKKRSTTGVTRRLSSARQLGD